MLRRIRSFCTSTRRRKVITATVTTLVVCASTALAYYLVTGGSGSGSATVGSATGSLTLHPTFASNGLVPGAQEAFSVTADNPNSSAGQVNALGVQSITDSASGCDVSQFDVIWPNGNKSTTSPTYTLTSPRGVPANSTGTTVLSGASIEMKDNGQDQGACAGTTLTVNMTSG